MRTHLKPVAGIVLWAALAIAQGPRAAEPNVIRAIDVAEKDGGVALAIQGSRAPSYTVFKLQDPPRLVVDIAGGDVSAVPSPLPVGKGGVIGVSTAQYNDEKSAVGRVIVAIDPAARYEVSPRGDSVVVRVQPASASAAAEALPAAVASAGPSTPTSTPTAAPTLPGT